MNEDDLSVQQAALLAHDRLAQPRGWQPRPDYMDALRRNALPGMTSGNGDSEGSPTHVKKHVCEGFQWIGQSFKYCDGCGSPYWEHTYIREFKSDSSPFAPEPWVLVPITPEMADVVRRTWDVPPEANVVYPLSSCAKNL